MNTNPYPTLTAVAVLVGRPVTDDGGDPFILLTPGPLTDTSTLALLTADGTWQQQTGTDVRASDLTADTDPQHVAAWLTATDPVPEAVAMIEAVLSTYCGRTGLRPADRYLVLAELLADAATYADSLTGDDGTPENTPEPGEVFELLTARATQYATDVRSEHTALTLMHRVGTILGAPVVEDDGGPALLLARNEAGEEALVAYTWPEGNGWEWTDNATDERGSTSDLTVESDPVDVVTWLRSIIADHAARTA